MSWRAYFRRERTLADAAVHLIAETRNGVRCNTDGEVNATADLASVTCASCRSLALAGRLS